MDLTIFKTVVLVIVSILRLAATIPLFLTARRNRLVNLYWLSLSFFALTISIPFAATGALNNPWIFWTFISITEIALIMFIHTTFHQGRRSPMPIFMGLAIIGLIGGLYGNATNNFTLSAWFVYPNAVLIWGWHMIEAYQGYKSVAAQRSTEEWVKSRYRLMIAYAALDFLGAIGGVLITTNLITSSISALTIVGLNVASATLQILVWLMPERYRRWLNRNQQSHEAERTEAEATTILITLSSAMAENTGLTQILCGFALRAAIKKQLGTEDGAAIARHIHTMNFQAWTRLLNRADLHHLLMSESGQDAKINIALANAQRSLIKLQSLFTLTAK